MNQEQIEERTTLLKLLGVRAALYTRKGPRHIEQLWVCGNQILLMGHWLVVSNEFISLLYKQELSIEDTETFRIWVATGCQLP